MMRLPEFKRLLPSSVAGAARMLDEHPGEAKLIAGGTSLLVLMKQRVITPKYIVDLTTMPDLEYLAYDDKNGLRIGPLTKLMSLFSDVRIQQKYPAIAQAALSVGGNQHQHMGTIGGNICLDTRCWFYNQSHTWRKSRPACIKLGGNTCYMASRSKICVAVYSGDMAPSLIALGAKIKLVGHKRNRVIPLSDLYRGDGEAYLTIEPDEVLREISVPPPLPNSFSSYMKVRMRNAIDFPIAGVAVNLALSKGECSLAQVVFNGIASSPVVAQDTSRYLIGKEITGDLLQQASEKAFQEAKPISDTGGYPPMYRKKIVGIYTKRALEQVLSKLSQKAIGDDSLEKAHRT